MIVYLYEKLSDGLHHYSPLSERQYYNASAMTSHGYFVLMPDIVFRPREPGLSVAECVTAALKEALAKGLVNEKKIGVMGHSWGGFDAAFLATHTTLFAAARRWRSDHGSGQQLRKSSLEQRHCRDRSY